MRHLFSVGRVLLPVVMVSGLGCASGVIHTTPLAGVDRIPAKLAVYPLLSNTVSPASRGELAVEPLSTREDADRENIYIQPAAESELHITASSQMLTSELLVCLARRGFDLRETPFETLNANGEGEGNAFVISLALLDELRERYGVTAVIIGNAFFDRDSGRNPGNSRVTAAYLKVIDTESLQVLCQVSMSYDAMGRKMDQIADTMAQQLAIMAGLEEERMPEL